MLLLECADEVEVEEIHLLRPNKEGALSPF